MLAYADRNRAVAHLALGYNRLGQRLGVGAYGQVAAVEVANGIERCGTLHRATCVLLPELNRALV